MSVSPAKSLAGVSSSNNARLRRSSLPPTSWSPPPLASDICFRQLTGEQEPDEPPHAAEKALASACAEALHVDVDAVFGVAGEVLDLPSPCLDLVVGAIDVDDVEEEAIHTLHLVLDELQVTKDAAEQPRLVFQDPGQPPQQ
ncbi:hypothetical protein GUJ93_ZPchr0016g2606 [Zizania palustris]|uniref:Uncharacterized protein n=1 Tax=Zizania palustris TaxID=103762 RepID=A0A8J5W6A3_ZIZPA|nr:hypothetical protein GUJ93_ZPchr0016g2606 [Zizania palustris]